MATAREILAGRAAVELSLRDKLKAGLDAAQHRLQRFAVNVAAIGISFATVSAMAQRAMSIISGTFTGPADQLQNLADRTGLSVELLQTLAESGADSGATLEDVGAASKSMANFLQQAERGGAGAAETLAELGVSSAALLAASPDERLRMMADAIGSIGEPARRAALAQDVFGKGAYGLLPVLSAGSGAIDAYRKRLEEIGAMSSAEQVAAADNLGDAFGRLKRRLESVAVSAIGAIAPMLQKVVDAAVGVVEIFNRWIAANPALAQTLGIVVAGVIGATLALAVFTGAILAASAVASAAATVWGVATAAVGAFSAVMAVVATPVGAVVAIAVALVAALGVLGVTLLATTETGRALVSSWMTSFNALLTFVKQVFGGIFDALAAGNLGLAGQIAMAGLHVAWQVGFGKLKTVTANAIAWIGSTILDGMAWALDKLAWIIDEHIAGINLILRSLGANEIGFNTANLVTAAESASEALKSGAKAYADDIAHGVGEAKGTLDKLTEQAKAERKAREDALKVPKLPDRGGEAGGGAKAPDIAQHLAKQIGSGTFSATTAGALGAASRAEKIWGDMMELDRKAEEHLAAIRDKLEDGGPVLVGA